MRSLLLAFTFLAMALPQQSHARDGEIRFQIALGYMNYAKVMCVGNKGKTKNWTAVQTNSTFNCPRRTDSGGTTQYILIHWKEWVAHQTVTEMRFSRSSGTNNSRYTYFNCDSDERLFIKTEATDAFTYSTARCEDDGQSD